jgi:hypothetical protein
VLEVKIKLNIKKQKIEITEEEARELQKELNSLFGAKIAQERPRTIPTVKFNIPNDQGGWLEWSCDAEE